MREFGLFAFPSARGEHWFRPNLPRKKRRDFPAHSSLDVYARHLLPSRASCLRSTWQLRRRRCCAVRISRHRSSLPARQSDGMDAQDGLLEAFTPQQADEIDIKPAITARFAAGFMTQYRQLPRELRRSGIWLTLESELDSPSDRAMIERLKALCRKYGLFLFIQTIRDGRGWQQMSGPSLEGDVYRPKSIPSWSVCIHGLLSRDNS